MLFTVELAGVVNLCFRHQNDGTWRQCTHEMSLQKSDFTCKTVSEVTAHSNITDGFDIDGAVFDIDPHQWPRANN